MNILALDTSMGLCSAAVLRATESGQVRVLRESEMQRGHAEALMPMVEDVLTQAGLTAQGLDTIAATQGPGSFTGVRIAIAAARGLALTSRASLYGSDSLTVMARAALRAGLSPRTPFAVAVDARRGMVYLTTHDPKGVRLKGPLLLSPADAVAGLGAAVPLVIGSGAELLIEAVGHDGPQLSAAMSELQPGAMALAELANEATTRTSVLRPLYLRPPDAKPQKPALEHQP